MHTRSLPRRGPRLTEVRLCPTSKKICYSTASAADNALRKIADDVNPFRREYRRYQCPDCSLWHLSCHEPPAHLSGYAEHRDQQAVPSVTDMRWLAEMYYLESRRSDAVAYLLDSKGSNSAYYGYVTLSPAPAAGCSPQASSVSSAPARRRRSVVCQRWGPRPRRRCSPSSRRQARRYVPMASA
jgi:hypothetical protein